ncbi:hypothetical protein AVEN_269313-1 [Araneus ventricosus]|uniref:Uncharacterized protein n=1 Tax=Araneus ventricosus TaxID=182803 RepID=A0A4Y2I3A0_ARAVE|nr:hypothetical protein AVEN_269313-1 [Araneus ventricosus]
MILPVNLAFECVRNDVNVLEHVRCSHVSKKCRHSRMHNPKPGHVEDPDISQDVNLKSGRMRGNLDAFPLIGRLERAEPLEHKGTETVRCFLWTLYSLFSFTAALSCFFSSPAKEDVVIL